LAERDGFEPEISLAVRETPWGCIGSLRPVEQKVCLETDAATTLVRSRPLLGLQRPPSRAALRPGYFFENRKHNVRRGIAKARPQLNMWSTAEPVGCAWIADNLGPVGRLDDLSRGLSLLAAFRADAPCAGLAERRYSR
jgi:hypothetical protein